MEGRPIRHACLTRPPPFFQPVQPAGTSTVRTNANVPQALGTKNIVIGTITKQPNVGTIVAGSPSSVEIEVVEPREVRKPGRHGGQRPAGPELGRAPGGHGDGLPRATTPRRRRRAPARSPTTRRCRPARPQTAGSRSTAAPRGFPAADLAGDFGAGQRHDLPGPGARGVRQRRQHQERLVARLEHAGGHRPHGHAVGLAEPRGEGRYGHAEGGHCRPRSPDGYLWRCVMHPGRRIRVATREEPPYSYRPVRPARRPRSARPRQA